MELVHQLFTNYIPLLIQTWSNVGTSPSVPLRIHILFCGVTVPCLICIIHTKIDIISFAGKSVTKAKAYFLLFILHKSHVNFSPFFPQSYVFSSLKQRPATSSGKICDKWENFGNHIRVYRLKHWCHCAACDKDTCTYTVFPCIPTPHNEHYVQSQYNLISR